MKKILSLILLFNSAESYFWQNDSKNIEYFSKEELDSFVDELIEEMFPNILSEMFVFVKNKTLGGYLLRQQEFFSMLEEKACFKQLKDELKCEFLLYISPYDTKEQIKNKAEDYLKFFNIKMKRGMFNRLESYYYRDNDLQNNTYSKEELDSLVDELIEERLPNVLSDIFSFIEKQSFKDKHNKIIGFRFILSLICKKKLQTDIKDFVKCKVNYSSCSTKEQIKYQVDYYILNFM